MFVISANEVPKPDCITRWQNKNDVLRCYLNDAPRSSTPKMTEHKKILGQKLSFRNFKLQRPEATPFSCSNLGPCTFSPSILSLRTEHPTSPFQVDEQLNHVSDPSPIVPRFQSQHALRWPSHNLAVFGPMCFGYLLVPLHMLGCRGSVELSPNARDWDPYVLYHATRHRWVVGVALEI